MNASTIASIGHIFYLEKCRNKRILLRTPVSSIPNALSFSLSLTQRGDKIAITLSVYLSAYRRRNSSRRDFLASIISRQQKASKTKAGNALHIPWSETAWSRRSNARGGATFHSSLVPSRCTGAPRARCIGFTEPDLTLAISMLMRDHANACISRGPTVVDFNYGLLALAVARYRNRDARGATPSACSLGLSARKGRILWSEREWPGSKSTLREP